jgi:hypothetical protein
MGKTSRGRRPSVVPGKKPRCIECGAEPRRTGRDVYYRHKSSCSQATRDEKR